MPESNKRPTELLTKEQLERHKKYCQDFGIWQMSVAQECAIAILTGAHAEYRWLKRRQDDARLAEQTDGTATERQEVADGQRGQGGDGADDGDGSLHI